MKGDTIMVKKLKALGEEAGHRRRRTARQPARASVKDSAQQIWLAGMGAFSKAQAEGGKVFEALVKEGLSLQRKTQAVAEEKISEVTSKMSDMAGDMSGKAAPALGQARDDLRGARRQGAEQASACRRRRTSTR